MTQPADYAMVANKARALFGREAERWLAKPNRSFAQLTPYELAQTPVGAQVVLEELDRTILLKPTH
jgi:uncharacterized protein (DUF2384 family)